LTGLDLFGFALAQLSFDDTAKVDVNITHRDQDPSSNVLSWAVWSAAGIGRRSKG